MPLISEFFGILITMYSEAGVKHHKPHLHSKYNEYKAVFDFDGNVIKGELPKKQEHMVSGWIAIHQEELMQNWELLQKGEDSIRIDPLR